MIYESEKMRLEGIRIIKTAGEYKCLVCKDLTSGGKSLCTVLAVHDHEVVRAMLEIFEGQENRPEEDFSMGEEYIFVFPYRRERPLDSFYMGDAYPLQECEDVCINVLLTCISCNLPYPFLYLIVRYYCGFCFSFHKIKYLYTDVFPRTGNHGRFSAWSEIHGCISTHNSTTNHQITKEQPCFIKIG